MTTETKTTMVLQTMPMKPGYRPRLTEEQAVEIVRAYHTDQANMVQLAAKYGTSKQTIWLIVRGKTFPNAYKTVEAELGPAPEPKAVGA